MSIWRRVACWISKATGAQAYAKVRAPPPPPHKYTHTHTRTQAQVRTRTHTHKYLRHSKALIFHGNKGFTTARQCYVISTLPVLLLKWYRPTKPLHSLTCQQAYCCIKAEV